MLSLKVEIDGNSGFCFGVVYAIEMAEDILNEQGYLYCLGDIVHNDEEIRRLQAKGLEIINHEALKHIHNEKVLIRAHGEPPSTYRVAVANNLELIDASCPVVLKLQNRIRRSYEKHEKIYIYGKSGHAEVEGLLGQTHQEAVVFNDITELDMTTLPPYLTLYSQTTKSTDKFNQISTTLQLAGIQVMAHDTICRQVSNRDKELRNFVDNFDIVLFVSGTQSSNGKVLYEVCKEKNPNTYLISCKENIQSAWFQRGNRVGICGATSTPMWLMEEVRDVLLQL